MDVATERRAIALYEEVQDWPHETRDARLGALLAGEPGLLTKVRAMLRADSLSAMIPTEPPEPHLDIVEAEAPERVGAYRIRGELGRGGMGIVYRASRDDGMFEQEVAIKLIRRSLLAGSALEQFAVERDIMGRLHHPHIAQIYDAGVTADGASYIVMELIAGDQITTTCERLGPAVSPRLALFVEACEAVDFAHRNLIVHADIKPNNVVVAEGFGVKLLDFGIGALIDPTREPTPGRGTGHTPGYASPERMAGAAPSIGDDVFALGKLLHALLNSAEGVDDDLRAVAKKASAATADERYANVRELVADIDAWRTHHPVAARPPSRLHDMRLRWRRHRLAFSLAAIATVALVAVAGITTFLYLRADAARLSAEQRLRETRALTRFMLGDVVSDMRGLPGSNSLRQTIATRAETTLDDLGRLPNAPPEIQIDDAEAYAQVGMVLADIDSGPLKVEQTTAVLARAEASLRRLAAAYPDRADLRMSLAQTLVTEAATTDIAKDQHARANRWLDEADTLFDHLPPTREARMARWEADLVRADALDKEGDWKALAGLLTVILRRVATIPEGHGGDAVDWALHLEETYSDRGDMRYYSGDEPGSLQDYERGQALLDRGTTTRPDARLVYRQAYGGFNIASTLSDLHRYKEELAWTERGVAAAARLRSFEDSPRARHMQNILTLQLGTALHDVGRMPEAIAAAEESIAGRKALLALEPNVYEAQRAVPVGLRPLAEIYAAAGQREKACAAIREAAAGWEALRRRNTLTHFDGTDEQTLVAKESTKWHCDIPVALPRKPVKRMAPGTAVGGNA
jgi:serine/threonine-protein kinase